MSNIVHRHGDLRTCGASTIVVGQNTVFAGGQLIAVDADPNSHGAGNLIAATREVYINGRMVVNVGDDAYADNLCFDLGGEHCSPNALTGLPTVIIGDPLYI